MNLAEFAEALAGFDLMRISYVPGKVLSLQLQGIARSADGSHAVAEYQLEFFRPSAVQIDLDCTPVTKLRQTKPLEVNTSSAAGNVQKVRVFFDTGLIQLMASDLNCAELRNYKFSDDDERRYRPRR